MVSDYTEMKLFSNIILFMRHTLINITVLAMAIWEHFQLERHKGRVSWYSVTFKQSVPINQPYLILIHNPNHITGLYINSQFNECLNSISIASLSCS